MFVDVCACGIFRRVLLLVVVDSNALVDFEWVAYIVECVVCLGKSA